MKKINPKNQNACPHCGGVNGYRVVKNNRSIYHGAWGTLYNKLVLKCEEESQIAVCRDCEKPFDIIDI